MKEHESSKEDATAGKQMCLGSQWTKPVSLVPWIVLTLGWIALTFGWILLVVVWNGPNAVVGQSGLVSGLMSPESGKLVVSHEAITIPMQQYVLIRTAAGVGAVILTNETTTTKGKTEYNEVRYRWYFTPQTKGLLTDAAPTSGESVAFEQYVSHPTEKQNVFQIEDAGSDARIRCGPIELTWSSGNHLYMPIDTAMQLANTGQHNLNDVRLDDTSLIWCGRQPVEFPGKSEDVSPNSKNVRNSGPGGPG